MQAFTKERDILDVWFDSGVSSYAVLTCSALADITNRHNREFAADLYLEGSDQHRVSPSLHQSTHGALTVFGSFVDPVQGWFQSSMFCSLVATDKTCSKSFLTHGFVVDKDGRKMSKSEGNGIAPQEVIEQFNADVLRMWVRSLLQWLCVSDALSKSNAFFPHSGMQC